MDSGASGPNGFNDSAELVGVSGEDAVVETSGDHDEVRVDDVSGPGEREKSAKRSAIVERVDRDGPQKHVESLTVSSAEDRARMSFADGEVDGGGSAWNQGDRCRLAALPYDLQCAVTAFEAEAVDVGELVEPTGRSEPPGHDGSSQATLFKTMPVSLNV